MERGLPVRVGFGVGLVAGCVLALQVLLTRFFSASLFYHFSFLSISLALLGGGAGAPTGSTGARSRSSWRAGRSASRSCCW
jgi:hypothetical protein